MLTDKGEKADRMVRDSFPVPWELTVSGEKKKTYHWRFRVYNLYFGFTLEGKDEWRFGASGTSTNTWLGSESSQGKSPREAYDNFIQSAQYKSERATMALEEAPAVLGRYRQLPVETMSMNLWMNDEAGEEVWIPQLTTSDTAKIWDGSKGGYSGDPQGGFAGVKKRLLEHLTKERERMALVRDKHGVEWYQEIIDRVQGVTNPKFGVF